MSPVFRKWLGASALAVALAGSTGLAVTPAQAAVSKAVGEALATAQKLVQSGQSAAAITKIQAGRAAATNAEERSKLDQMELYAYSAARRWKEAAALADRLGLPAKQRFGLHYNAGNHAKAVEIAKSLPGDYGVQSQVPQIFLAAGKYAGAKKGYEELIAKFGEKKELLQGLAATQFKMGDKAAYIGTLSKLIRLDPSPDNWKRLINDQLKQTMPDVARLQLYQLMYETGGMVEPPTIDEMAKIAIVMDAPGLAAQVLKEKAPTSPLVPVAANRTTRWAAEVAGKAKTAKTGAEFMKVGRTYFGMGQFPQAGAMFKKAIPAGADPGEANLSLGVNAFKSGDLAGAKAAFAAVPANSTYRDAAQLWELFRSLKR